ncbi:MFS transporter [Polymorphobacter glacialis]|uniref:MFS transporter n=1 Tax=Sandarakinorhabdus glacialis TaxID=1614636 RepID=A0A917EAJ0_9SPHN|nr:MFS transporter [Polymorphobacter glacialis]GGE18344.1 MFS transporter [Polymorphobacter glacialis]
MTIKRGVLAAFAAPCLPIAAVGLPVVVYLPPYYAGTLGLDLAVVGMLFFLVRVVDVPLDPFIGHMLDRTETRFGRFRPWMVAGALLMMAGVFAVFMASPGLSPMRAFGGLFLMYVGFSAAVVSHTAWGAVLSDDYHERSRVFGWWQASNLAGLLLILAVPPAAQYLAGSNDPSIGVHAMGWVIICTLPLAVAWTVLRVPERARKGGEHHRLSDIWGVVKLPLLRRLLLIDLLSSLAPGLGGALLLFFFTSARGYTMAQSSSMLLFYFAAGMVAAPWWAKIARRTSKHRAIMWALVVYAVMQSLIVVLPRGNFWLAAAGLGLAGIPAVAPAFLLRAMLADLSDAETVRTGHEKTALFYAALVVVQKLGYAIPVGVSYALLGLIGFEPELTTRNSPDAILGLIVLFVVPPALLALAGAAVVRGWPIDADTQARNAAALAE